MERLGHSSILERELYLLELADPEQIPDNLELGSARFACLLAWDARGVSAERIVNFANKLMDRGLVFVCAWGSDCKRVHDIFDEERETTHLDALVPGIIMTTWHDKEPLSETLWFALYCTLPDEAYTAGCDSTLAIVIGSSEWATEVREAFGDPQGFLERNPNSRDP